MNDFGMRVKELREKLGLGIYQLADKSGVSVETIYRYEWGQTREPSLRNVEKLARVLNVKPAVLVGWE